MKCNIAWKCCSGRTVRASTCPCRASSAARTPCRSLVATPMTQVILLQSVEAFISRKLCSRSSRVYLDFGLQVHDCTHFLGCPRCTQGRNGLQHCSLDYNGASELRRFNRRARGIIASVRTCDLPAHHDVCHLAIVPARLVRGQSAGLDLRQRRQSARILVLSRLRWDRRQGLCPALLCSSTVDVIL